MVAGLDKPKPVHMSSDEARAALLEGVEFPGGLSVDGSLWLEDCTALTALPEGLSVDGWLLLEDCTALTALPFGLSVGGSLHLGGCTALTSLPDCLHVEEWLWLNGCTALTALPEGLSVGSLDLRGCTALTALPDGLSFGGSLWLDMVWVSGSECGINAEIPESVAVGLAGRDLRLHQLIDHPLMQAGTALGDAIMLRAGAGYDTEFPLILQLDRTLFNMRSA